MKNIITILIRQVTSYIQYTQRIPMFIGFFIMLVFIFLGFQFNNFDTVTHYLLGPFVDDNGNGRYNTSSFLLLYAQVSFIFYLLGGLLGLILKRLYKKEIDLKFKTKIKIALTTAIAGYVLAGILWAISPTEKIMTDSTNPWLILITFFVFTIIVSIYSFAVDAVINLCKKPKAVWKI